MQARTLFEYYWETDEAFAILKMLDISICSRRSECPFTLISTTKREPTISHKWNNKGDKVRKGDTLPITVLLHF